MKNTSSLLLLLVVMLISGCNQHVKNEGGNKNGAGGEGKIQSTQAANPDEKDVTSEQLFKLTKEAREGDIPALLELGRRNLHGEGAPSDPTQAVHWFSLAAEKGDPYAANQLGACYDDGLGVPRNAKKAYEWYLRAVQLSLEMLKEQSDPAPLPLRTMHAVACFNVGICLYRGDGVAKDDRAAIEYLEKAAVEFGPARKCLAEMADRGNQEANLALEQAVRKGNELSAVESLFMTREFSEHLQSLKKRGTKFEIIIGHNTPDHVTIRIRPSPASPKSSEQIFFYGIKDNRCFVESQGGKMREIQ